MKITTSAFLTGLLTITLTSLYTPAWSSSAAAQSLAEAYKVVNADHPGRTAGKTEVLEIFWYGCPHCYAFEPYLRQWLATESGKIEFRLMPGILNRGWIAHARAYYTAESMGVVDRIHHALFDAIHKDKRNIFSDAEIRAFFIEQGVEAARFDEVYNSADIDDKLRQAIQIQMQYKIEGVPSIIINDKYLSSPTLARGYEELLKVMNHLVDKDSVGSVAQ